MRFTLVLAVLLVATAGLAGCLDDGGEQLEEQADPPETQEEPTEEPQPEDGEQPSEDEDEADEQADGSEDTDAGEQDGTDDEEQDEQTGDEQVEAPKTAVLAHIDTGVNPYHEVFRDDSELAYTHPSEYIDGFPEDAPALELTLDADSYADALEADEEVWDEVEQGQLYWIPGTRIVGAISLDDGGAREGVEETPILDDHGHGTMTASRAVGQSTSLAPDARLVTIEGIGSEGVRWAADAGWIDVQTNSWLSRVPAPANQAQDDVPELGLDSESEAFAYAADRMITFAASGNGAGYTAGGAPMPTYTLSTAPDDVILVGAHDNGYLAPWSGSPPHLVADGHSSLAAVFDSIDAKEPHRYACCTSSAAPYAAGAAAHLVAEARQLADEASFGIEEGIVARGDELDAGPLDDGELTRAELREVLLHTAQKRPLPTYHDGDTHWTAEPTEDEPAEPTEPGENAYCPGCWTAPVRYDDLPGEVPTFLYTGYGAINVFSDQAAVSVLAGNTDAPNRSDVDRFYRADQTVRETYYPGPSGQP